MRLFDNFFWGILFIAAGILFLLRYFFKLDIPVWRTLIAFLLIYSGVVIAFGGFGTKDKNNIVFGNGSINVSDNKYKKAEYNIVFSNGKVDLLGIVPSVERQKIEINAVFSDGTVFVSKEAPYTIKVNSAFASVTLPDNSQISFGNDTYRSKNFNPGMPYFEIEANAVFGALKVIER